MGTTNYTIRLEPKCSGTIRVDAIKEKLQQRGYEESEPFSANELRFLLNKPAYALHARLEMDSSNAYVQRVSIDLDTRPLLIEAISAAAAELSGIACSLAHDDATAQMSIHYEEASGAQIQEPSESDQPCDLCSRLERSILQKKQSLQRFPSISTEEAMKWMEDFPQRREKFIAAVREGKN